jgi:mono/diheme cytochrome c family protein
MTCRALMSAGVLWMLLFAGWGCPWFSNMADQPSVRPFESAPRPAVANTIPIAATVRPAISYEEANNLPNPRQPSDASLARGKETYEIFCLVCHGATGAGDGPVAPKFVRPPNLKGASRGYTDGYIYALITNGRGNMPSYNRISTDERWDVINYLRQLQSQP